MSQPIPSTTSAFIHRHLTLLRSCSLRTPLRLIAHIDLDAFYAQCEMVRLNTPLTQPLAVQQWDSLIAVNYPARAFGITRMITAVEARKRCPELITQHVATFREGEGGHWRYREDAAERKGSDKVSLEPYRNESRRILGVIRGVLEGWVGRVVGGGVGEVFGGEAVGGGRYEQLVRVEKAGIDEVFVDLSALVYEVLLEKYPMLREGEAPRDLNERLPKPPTTVLEWGKEDLLVDLDVGQAEEDDPDWDDVCMLVGADIVRDVRRAIWERLKYTCSAGIARNKMMAKLGSACNKPNKQTIVRNRAVQQFLGGFPFTKIRALGGKLGKQVVEMFGTEQVGELLNVSLEQLRGKLGDETGLWLYDVIRGNEYSEVSVRTKIKSMLSTKSFRPGIKSTAQAEKWLKIFVADIYGRLLEEGVLENKRRPKVITIHWRTAGQMRSRQIPIPTGRPIDDTVLFDLGKTLLTQVVGEKNIWPCQILSLNVSGFEDGVTGNQSLDSFFRGNPGAKIAAPAAQQQGDIRQGYLHSSEPRKRRKVSDDDANNINHDHAAARSPGPIDEAEEESLFIQDNDPGHGPSHFTPTTITPVIDESALPTPQDSDDWAAIISAAQEPSFTCPRCSKSVPEPDRSEHEDWHFARDLYAQERQQHASITPPARHSTGSRGRGRRKGGSGNNDKRQSRLAF
ncbi:hypothetical protein AJ79_01842 [Helicocarpus griseus UAMH5409]|uniref:DNA polymerase eta n=1 Tax=Helicocarpus griseus UAMH5409 TaxID=1447875 RepID=A0A2B7Y5J9_9EURO|nr:hypothetical protein AJ79_01842 [Helicocarpus griseus UAMH5409]